MAPEPDDDGPESTIGALRDLVQSRGWQIVREQAEREYGPAGYGREMQRALASVPTGPERAYELARIAEQVDATARAVNALIKWPEEQIARLTPKKPPRFAGIRGISR